MIKFTLIENSLDSINQGLYFFKKAESDNCISSYKHSLLCLFQGAELVLKETLVLIDPIIIFDKNSLFKHCKSPLTPTLDELYNCKSIDIGGISQNLKKHYSDTFKSANVKSLEKLAIERNKFQHFAIEISTEKLKKMLLELYLLVIKPAFKIIQSSYNTSDKDYSENITYRIAKFEESFLTVKTGVSDGFAISMCPKCKDNYHFIIYEENSHPIYSYCLSCDYQLQDLNSCGNEECPECGWLTLVYDTKHKAGVCLFDKCYFSNQLGFVEMEPCETCSGYKVEQSCWQCTPEA
ncbi:MAG: hypothetical protein RPR97_14535 [Colwellia sp.]